MGPLPQPLYCCDYGPFLKVGGSISHQINRLRNSSTDLVDEVIVDMEYLPTCTVIKGQISPAI